LYDLEGWVLLVGVDYLNATSLHLAEFRAAYPSKKEVMCGGPMVVDGQRTWVRYKDYYTDDSDFNRVGAAFSEETGLVRSGRLGYGSALLMPQRQLVDFAVDWFEKNRR
jgi:aminoglycoside 3-N-acetyltransferase